MADEPVYLIEGETTEAKILARLLGRVPADLDTSEGSYIYDALAPVAVELALAAIMAQEVLRRGFASTTFGTYLDMRCEEHGITRRPAVKATGQVTFTGTPGAVIPSGTQVSTAGSEATPAIFFATKSDAQIGIDGTVAVAVEAVEAGAAGTVPAGTITVLAQPIAGVTGVTNAAPTSGGLDAESDASLLQRFLAWVRNPGASGNRADYLRWTWEVPGVGGVSVIPVGSGPGTVDIYIVDSDCAPASQTLVDAVQDYIAPPWRVPVEAESMTVGGYGTSIDASRADDSGDSVKMVYDAGGEGTIAQALGSSILPQPGIWQARVRIKVDATMGTTDLLRVGVWNNSTSSWCKTTPSGSVDAVRTFTASDLATSFTDYIVEFYWNGQDLIELRVARLTTDTTTVVWVDQVTFRSTFSTDRGDGKAPVGARVAVRPAKTVTIDVSALVIAAGYNPDNVKNAVKDAIKAYLLSLVFVDDNDVRYARVGQIILDTPGVIDYSNLLVNNGTANVAIADDEVAILGTVTLTT